MVTIYVVRHCEAEGQSPEAPLSDSGRQQAEQLKAFFQAHPLDGLISSACLRAQLTAEPLALAFGLPVRVDERLQERVLSAIPLSDQEERDRLKRAYDDPDLRYEGGETSREAASRALSCIADHLFSGKRNIAFVTHGHVMSLILRNYNPAFGYESWERLTYPDVYRLRFHDTWHYDGRIWREAGQTQMRR